MSARQCPEKQSARHQDDAEVRVENDSHRDTKQLLELVGNYVAPSTLERALL